MLLHYYARHERAVTGQAPPSPDVLPLAVTATRDEGGLVLAVRWQGQPQNGIKLYVQPPEGEPLELTSDKDGRATIEELHEGLYAVRAALVEEDRKGELDGQSYQKAMHQSTLTFVLPGEAAAATAGGANLTATELLAASRATRAVWEDFPGMKAQLSVSVDGRPSSGSVEISADGNVKLELDDAEAQKWAERVVGSVVQHRLPGNRLPVQASFADQAADHPLGRKLKLSEDLMGSVYRIRDHVVRQVNRTMGPQRFTISVLEVYRTGEGKYLPTVFTVSFWDGKTGELINAETHHDRWQRIDHWDMPVELLEVASGHDSYNVRSLKAADWQPLAREK